MIDYGKDGLFYQLFGAKENEDSLISMLEGVTEMEGQLTSATFDSGDEAIGEMITFGEGRTFCSVDCDMKDGGLVEITLHFGYSKGEEGPMLQEFSRVLMKNMFASQYGREYHNKSVLFLEEGHGEDSTYVRTIFIQSVNEGGETSEVAEESPFSQEKFFSYSMDRVEECGLNRLEGYWLAFLKNPLDERLKEIEELPEALQKAVRIAWERA